MMSDELRSPLLPSAEVSITVGSPTNGLGHSCRPSTAATEEYFDSCNDSPFSAVGAPSPPEELFQRPPSTADPFRNGTPDWGGVYGFLKAVLLLPVVLLRLVLFGLAIAVGFLATLLALKGWKDKDTPLPRWRARIMWITRFCARCILFAFGYQYIKRKGKVASREVAPIVVSNHLSYIEPIFFFYELFPTIVAAESHDNIPFVGMIIRAMQVLNPSRKNAVNEIKRKASQNEFPRVLLFPEGTTTNGRYLISFQLGAFIPGLPLQPVVIRYPHVHFDQSWGNISLAKLMARMFFQFHNFMEVEYLPVIVPLERKQENATQFAARTSYAMAAALNVVQTTYSYVDMILLTRASQHVKDECSRYTVEMGWAGTLFKISASEALDFLDEFLLMNPDSSGRVKYHLFATALGLGLNRLSEKIFCYFDIEKKGSITFRQFLIGSAYIRKQPLFLKACETAFNICGGSKNGYIPVKELQNITQTVTGTGNELFEKQFHTCDTNNDGFINKDDFVGCLRRKPVLIALFISSPEAEAYHIQV